MNSSISVEADSEVRIGAMARHRDLLDSELLATHFPIFRDAERVIADPVVRNRGTLGGSLCQADPLRRLVGGVHSTRRELRDHLKRRPKSGSNARLLCRSVRNGCGQ